MHTQQQMQRRASTTRPAAAAAGQPGARRRCRRAAAAPASGAAATAEQQQQQLQQLLTWAAANKVATDKVAVARDLATDAPVLVAAADLKPGDACLLVPEAAWLTPARAQKAAGLGRLIGGLEPWLQLALVLVAERAAGSAAAAAGVLPAAYVASTSPETSPLFWPERPLAMLEGTQLLQSLNGYRRFFRQQYDRLDAELFARDRAAFPSDVFTYDAFVRAVATVRSRLHAPLDVDPLALVPLADAVPHGRDANVAWRLKPAGLFGGGRALAVEALRAVRKGEQLRRDFGPGKSDSTVLLDHGALDAAAPRGGYTLTLTLPESDRYYDDKRDILERSGYGPSATFVLARGQEPPEAMMGFLRLMQLSGQDCFLLESIFEAQVWGFMCEPVSPDNEAAVCAAVADGAREALAGYPTTIDEDLAELRGGLAGKNARPVEEQLALQARLGEKEALDGVLAYFEGRAADLGGLEYYQERRLKRLGLVDDNGRTTYDSFFSDGIA